MKVEEFLKRMAQQTAKPKETIDKEIMKIINFWRKTGKPQYLSFRNKPKTDVEYLSHMFKKAGVDKDTALEYVKKELGLYYDPDGVTLEEEFENEWNSTMSDQKFRQEHFSFLR